MKFVATILYPRETYINLHVYSDGLNLSKRECCDTQDLGVSGRHANTIIIIQLLSVKQLTLNIKVDRKKPSNTSSLIFAGKPNRLHTGLCGFKIRLHVLCSLMFDLHYLQKDSALHPAAYWFISLFASPDITDCMT